MSYSHKDEALRDQLEVSLSMLKRQGLVEVWHDRRIIAGSPLDGAISAELEDANIILCLLSPEFLASDYCFDVEMKRALERHRAGEAKAIAVILRPCDWQNTDFAKYLVTPKDGKAISTWPNIDEAFLDVTHSIRAAIGAVSPGLVKEKAHIPDAEQFNTPVANPLPRSSNLRLKKTFTDAERDQFLQDTFEFMSRFFQGSLAQLQARNKGIEGRIRQIDGNAFTATIYQGGKKVEACSIRLGGMMGSGITFSHGDTAPSNSMNENLSVEHDDQKLFLKAMGMAHHGQFDRDHKLSMEGAAEYYWALLIRGLQGSGF